MRRSSVFLAAALTALTGGLGAWAAEHPRLVSLEATRCTACHGALIEHAVVHPPVAEDCTTCHEMTIGDDGTTVELIDQDPGLCVLCHDELEAAASDALPVPHFPVSDGCLSCHDPHGSANERMLVASVPSLCLDCHDAEDVATTHDGQITGETDCRRCHAPHGGARQALLAGDTVHPPFAEGQCASCHRAPFGGRIRLQRRGEELCTACHGDVTEVGAGGSSHPALIGTRGRAGCLGCHDPHMADRRRLLTRPGNEVCRECHGDIVARAEAETGHFPAADDCLSCHLPHVADHPRLLNEAPGDLCTTCHDPDDELAAAHLGAAVGDLRCTACHSPHGEGHRKLLARVLHPPVEDGCDTCHEGASDALVDDGESSLCLFCHDDIAAVIAAATVPHEALEVARCADCHNPHASAQDHLVSTPGAGPCLDCHDDLAPGDGQTAHSVIDLVGCRACHEPHGGERPKLLRASGNELCRGCHDPRAQPAGDGDTVTLLGRFAVPSAVAHEAATLRLSADGTREHPIAGHRVAGVPTPQELARTDTTFAGELSCLSCHDPHKGRHDLLRWNAGSSFEACTQCHPK